MGKGDIPTLKHRKERRSINPTIIIWYNRTPCTLYNAMLSIQNAQKTAEALNETAKTDPKIT